MKKISPPAKERSITSEAFHRMLDSYALAAGVAGVSLLALAEPSAAEIIYTRTHQVIAEGDSYMLDFNHDGITDLTIQNKYLKSCTYERHCSISESLAAIPAGTNKAVHNSYGAVAMKLGMRIGPRDAFSSALGKMASCIAYISYPNGSWVNVNDRYLGVKFNINGKTHYGWARISVQVELPLTITATLTGYAYETVPNKAIVAGQTKEGNDGVPNAVLNVPAAQSGTLGMLALGKK
jgi:hypothetical protein